MANIFEDNPNAYNFIITNNTTNEHYSLSEGGINIPPGATGSLQQFSIDFCLFKYKYTLFAAVKSWFDDGKLSAVPINGAAPVVCPWEPSSGGSGSSTNDTFRVKVSLLDTGPDYLEDKIVVDSNTLMAEILSVGGDQQLKLTGLKKEFTDLDDTPSSLTGQSGKLVQVNSAETGLEFKTWRQNLSFPALLTWVVDHNSGYEPIFQVTDVNGVPRHFISYSHVNNNRIEIYWDEPVAGTVRIR